MNIVDRLVSLFGTQAKVAEIAGVKQPSVAEWKAKNAVPMQRAKLLLQHAQQTGIPLSAEHFIAAAEPSQEAVA